MSNPQKQTVVVGAILGGIAFLVVMTVLTAIIVAFIHYHIKPHRYSKFNVKESFNCCFK